MKTTDWNVTHLGKSVRIRSFQSDDWHFRLEALRYESGSGKIAATLVSIVPSIRPGIVGHYELENIELIE